MTCDTVWCVTWYFSGKYDLKCHINFIMSQPPGNMYTLKQWMGHPCHQWERQPSIFDYQFKIFTHLCYLWQVAINQFIFWHPSPERYSLSYCWDSDRQLFIQWEGSFLTYTRNKEEHLNIAVVKSTQKIPPRHNGGIPIKIMGHSLRDQVAYFISNNMPRRDLTQTSM